jgi:transcriptional regulator with XRE-family HTH domain
MGSASRMKPEFLATKLYSIRQRFNYSLEKMAESLSDEKTQLRKSDISRYESGLREPSLIILLRYARLANVIVDVLIDDKLDLPNSLPSNLILDDILNRNS